jgi:hypothetical protein
MRRRTNWPKKRRGKRPKPRPPSRRLLRVLYPQAYRVETTEPPAALLPDDWEMRKK